MPVQLDVVVAVSLLVRVVGELDLVVDSNQRLVQYSVVDFVPQVYFDVIVLGAVEGVTGVVVPNSVPVQFLAPSAVPEEL